MKTKKKKLNERSLKLKNQKNMIDFNLVRKEPNSLELRAYLYQILIDDFELSIELRERFFNEFSGLGYNLSKWDLNAISEPDIRRILKEQYLLPEEIIYFKKEYNPTAISDNNYEDFPKIFTRVCFVSFDRGGLIVLQLYNWQIYLLFDATGKCLSGCFHDLQFGTDGKVMIESPESVFWKMLQYNGESFEDCEFFSPFDLPHFYNLLSS